jgi:hypothetical protein
MYQEPGIAIGVRSKKLKIMNEEYISKAGYKKRQIPNPGHCLFVCEYFIGLFL